MVDQVVESPSKERVKRNEYIPGLENMQEVGDKTIWLGMGIRTLPHCQVGGWAPFSVPFAYLKTFLTSGLKGQPFRSRQKA